MVMHGTRTARGRLRRALVAVALLIAGAAIAAPSSALGDSTEGTIAGRVLFPAGVTNPSVVAQLLPVDSPFRPDAPAYDGSYSTQVPAGRYRVEFLDQSGSSKLAYQFYGSGGDPTQATIVTVIAGQTTTLDDVTMQKQASVSGVLTDSDGNHADGNAYVLRHDSTGWDRVPVDAKVDEGQFSIGQLPAGTYRLRAYEAGYDLASEFYPHSDTLDGATSVSLTAGQAITNVTVPLRRAGHVTGHVTGPDGQPVVHTTVLAQRVDPVASDDIPHNPDGSVDWVEAGTDKNGFYELDGLDPGDYRIHVSGNDSLQAEYSGGTIHADDAQIIHVSAGDDLVHDQQLPEMGSVTVHVTDAAGDPVSGARPRILSSLDPEGSGYTASPDYDTDAQGDVTIQHVPLPDQGSYVLMVDRGATVVDPTYLGGDDAAHATTFDVPSGSNQTFDVTVHVVAPTITGSPSISGVPLVGRRLTLTPGSPSPVGVPETYQWLADGQPIDGATGLTFTPTAAQVGQSITARLTVDNGGVTATKIVADDADPVAEHEFADGASVTISDTTPSYAQTLTATVHGLTPAASTGSTWQWYRDGRAISGATGPTYVTTRYDLGLKLSAQRVARRSDYATDRISSRETASVPKAAAHITVKATARSGHRVQLDITMTATGVPTSLLDATAAAERVRAGSDVLKHVSIVNGHARLVLTSQPSGSQSYYVALTLPTQPFEPTTSAHHSVKVH